MAGPLVTTITNKANSLLTSADGVLTSAAQVLPPMTAMVGAFAFMAGCILGGYAILLAKSAAASNQQKNTYTQALVVLLSAVVMVNLPEVMNLFGNTFFDGDYKPQSVLAYATTAAPSQGPGGMLKAILGFVQFIGLLSFIKGWFVMNSIGKRQDATLGKGLTHIIGGIFAMNVVLAADVTASTFNIKGLSALMGSL